MSRSARSAVLITHRAHSYALCAIGFQKLITYTLDSSGPLPYNQRMTTVYAVVSGEYSDYSVECLFVSKKSAQDHVDQTNADDKWVRSCIEEFELHDDDHLPVWVQTVSLRGEFDDDGFSISPLEESTTWDWDYNRSCRPEIWMRARPAHGGTIYQEPRPRRFELIVSGDPVKAHDKWDAAVEKMRTDIASGALNPRKD